MECEHFITNCWPGPITFVIYFVSFCPHMIMPAPVSRAITMMRGKSTRLGIRETVWIGPTLFILSSCPAW